MAAVYRLATSMSSATDGLWSHVEFHRRDRLETDCHRFGNRPLSHAIEFGKKGALRGSELRRWEFTKPDNWMGWATKGGPDGLAAEWAYIGAEYPDATEIVSMGLELIYTRPAKLATDDPRLFDFTVDWVMRR